MRFRCLDAGNSLPSKYPSGQGASKHCKGWTIGQFVLGLLAACLLLQAPAAAQVKGVRRVLLFYETGTSPGSTLLDQGVRSALDSSPYQIEYYREYMETILFPDPALQAELQHFYIRKYQDRRLDLIITFGPGAYRFMLDSHDKYFPDVPVVFCFVPENTQPLPKPDSLFTGTQLKLDPVRTLEAAMRLQPGIRHLAVVSGAAPFDKQFEVMVRKDLLDYASNIDISYLTDLPMPALVERLKHLPDHTVVLVVSFSRDAAGTTLMAASQALPVIVAASNAPVLSSVDTFLNHGEVGGSVYSFAAEGQIAGETALRVLRGERPQNIPISTAPTVYMFDWQALKRWHMDPANLPPDSVVLNRVPTVWELYKGYIVGSILLVLVETLLITALLRERAKKKKVEASLVERLRFETFLSQLSTSLANAPEEEIDEKIEGSLARIGDLLGLERITLRKLSPDQSEFTATLTWHSQGTPPTPPAIRIDQYPRWAGRIMRGEFVSVQDVTLLPDEAGAEKEYFLQSGAVAVASAPLAAGGLTFGSVTFVSTSFRVLWTDDLVKQLKILAELFSNTLTRKRSTRALRASIAELRDSQASLRELGSRLIEAEERERARIARELHDDLGQRMALLGIGISQIGTAAAKSPSELKEQLEEAARLTSEVATTIQNLSHELHPTKLDVLGLIPSLRSLCREFSEHQLRVQFICDGVQKDFPKEIALCLYRIAQEALRNVVKHSGAAEAAVELANRGDCIELCVSDTGAGFDANAAKERLGLGLISINDRLRPLGGKLMIETGASQGTRIRVQVPFSMIQSSPSV